MARLSKANSMSRPLPEETLKAHVCSPQSVPANGSRHYARCGETQKLPCSGSLHESAPRVGHLGRSMNGPRASMSAPPLMTAPPVAAGVMSLTVESKMGAVAGGLWPSPRFPSPLIEPEGPDFRSPALRLASPQGTRRGSEWQAFEAQQTEFPMDSVVREPAGAAPCHFVPSCEKVAHALVGIAVQNPHS